MNKQEFFKILDRCSKIIYSEFDSVFYYYDPRYLRFDKLNKVLGKKLDDVKFIPDLTNIKAENILFDEDLSYDDDDKEYFWFDFEFWSKIAIYHNLIPYKIGEFDSTGDKKILKNMLEKWLTEYSDHFKEKIVTSSPNIISQEHCDILNKHKKWIIKE